MSSSQSDILLTLYTRDESVFTMQQISMLYPNIPQSVLLQKIRRAVKAGRLLCVRRGVYAKPGYTMEEVACVLYKPSYISLDYVLQHHGVNFQYDSAVSMVSYLSRDIEINGQLIRYRRIKGEIMINTIGIEQRGNINIATPERAFLDTLYLYPNYYFDHVDKLDQQLIKNILPIYHSATMEERVKKILSDGYK